MRARSCAVPCLLRRFELTGDHVAPQPKPQEPALLDGASSRFADAFTRRTTQLREGGVPGVRPWTWIAGAVAFTACVVLIVFAVASFGTGPDKKDTVNAETVALRPSVSPSNGSPSGTPSTPAPSGSPRRPVGAGGQSPRGSDSNTVAEGTRSATPSQGSSALNSSSPRPQSGATTRAGAGSGSSRGVGGGASARATQQAQGTTYPGVAVYSHASGRCVTAAGARTSPAKVGTSLEIRDCAGGSWQKVDFRSDGTARMFGLCMEIAWASQQNGAAIQLAKCNGGWAQQFWLNGSHDLVNSEIGKCVDVTDGHTVNGTRLQLWSCAGTDNQKWSKY
ncbi:ricin-type beta-trefoil lectin domain protein [Streptomyces sp. NPDC046977]|uniref:ricin-type beta-trefoil lectin domain protein n=1 Tax=Streptomyces sp. NPDC046977 TaxID=3154703 RepID=UPI0034065383